MKNLLKIKIKKKLLYLIDIDIKKKIGNNQRKNKSINTWLKRLKITKD